MNPKGLYALSREVGPDFFTGRHNIGYWAWEVGGAVPVEWWPAFQLLDEVWVGSQYNADTISGFSPIPVHPVTLPVSVTDVAAVERSGLGLPEGFLFLFAFDHESDFARKNPLAVVRAFARAFPPGSGAALVVKTMNVEHHPDEHRRLREAADAHADVHVFDRRAPAEEKNAMIAACNCYVSLHRAEGFGLTMAEAMYLGKPVIATGYSGNLEFMRPANSYLVKYRLTRAGEAGGQPYYPADGQWAEPDTSHAARLMRHVFENRHEARKRGEAAGFSRGGRTGIASPPRVPRRRPAR